MLYSLAHQASEQKKTGTNLPNAGNPDEIEFSIDETYDMETGTFIAGSCFRPNQAKSYYNFGDDFVFEGVYAEIAFVIFHDGEAVEIPTHAMLLSDMEEEEIYGVSEFNAFLPKNTRTIWPMVTWRCSGEVQTKRNCFT